MAITYDGKFFCPYCAKDKKHTIEMPSSISNSFTNSWEVINQCLKCKEHFVCKVYINISVSTEKVKMGENKMNLMKNFDTPLSYEQLKKENPVKETVTTRIIKDWLFIRGFDGLYNPKKGDFQCCCELEDLCGCGGDDNGIYNCLPGYKRAVRLEDRGRDWYGYTIDPKR